MTSSRYIIRANVRKRFEPLEGGTGSSRYRDGAARFELGDEIVTVRPPFGLAHEGEYAFVHVEPLLAALAEEHFVGVLLVRLGGYAVGVFSGEELVASKVGRRNVYGRHRAGGSSANRFRRRREEQARELIQDAAETAWRVLGPRLSGLEAIALGGDRFAVRKTIAARRELAALDEKALPHFLAVAEPRRQVLERAIHEVYAAEVETELGAG
ncbi:MAG: acVLRF1 family peptidyl-tRNA hydrolase [Gaiellaceae bacterium]